VRASALDWTIVRPAIVLGAGSPIAKSLASLARLPVTPIFGDGKVRIQPVHADDVASALWAWHVDRATIGQVIELGGPEQLSFEEFFRRLRLAVGKRRGPIVHLPLAITIWSLAQIEKVLPPILPMTAGQLYSFRHDSLATPSPFTETRRATMCSVERMLADAAQETA
jgi:NADH dehydrogenase